MQSKVGEMQEKLKGVEVTGSAGGDMIQIDINGQMEVVAVRISPEVVDPNDIQMVTDLFHAAIADALFKIKEKLREEMSTLTGGMGLPPGMLGM